MDFIIPILQMRLLRLQAVKLRVISQLHGGVKLGALVSQTTDSPYFMNIRLGQILVLWEVLCRVEWPTALSISAKKTK